MPSAASAKSPVLLVCGDDEFAVKQRAREAYQKWCAELGGMDHEVIDGSAANAGEALKALANLRAALQTLPFFGSAKVVWLKDCNFFGEERAASAAAVTEALADFSAELKEFTWQNVRLLVSAGKVDRRKTIYKTLEKIGAVESFAGLSADDRDWADQAQTIASRALADAGVEIAPEALAALVANVGPNTRMLNSEVEKIVLYTAPRTRIEPADVAAICTRNKQARAFALADALGDRNLALLLACLDQELWEIRRDPSRSEIGLLYGLIAKVRVLIFLREMQTRGWLKQEADFNRFKSQLTRVPADALPEDKKINPLAQNPYVLFRALPQTKNYTSAELIAAMEALLECNQKLISRSLDAALVLQQTLIHIIQRPGDEAKPVRARPALAA